jgi:2,4-dienoyl-CoA reductase-like NADH-dependent reductase (Old Yellow Enzyme family)
MSKLLSPFTIKDITLKNRIVVSPMCQYSAIDGYAGDWHIVHYGGRASGGASLIIQEATAVSPEGRITPGDLGLYSDGHMEKFRSIARFITEQGSVAGIQLAHAGRKASCSRPWEGGMQLQEDEGGWVTVAPSALPFNPEDRMPAELDMSGIEKIICDFTLAAGRALQAGYQVVEIHAAHGYLIHEFLSPLSNQRTDSYGGSFENRIRLLLRIVKAVQSVWPKNLPLFVRISATDWVEGGWDIDEAVRLASVLKDLGVDLIDCSSGGMVPWAKIPFGPGYQVPLSSRIRNEAGILTGTVGLITGAGQAEEILANEQADLILIGRLSLRDPYFALNAARELGEEAEWPLQYLRAKP